MINLHSITVQYNDFLKKKKIPTFCSRISLFRSSKAFSCSVVLSNMVLPPTSSLLSIAYVCERNNWRENYIKSTAKPNCKKLSHKKNIAKMIHVFLMNKKFNSRETLSLLPMKDRTFCRKYFLVCIKMTRYFLSVK